MPAANQWNAPRDTLRLRFRPPAMAPPAPPAGAPPAARNAAASRAASLADVAHPSSAASACRGGMAAGLSRARVGAGASAGAGADAGLQVEHRAGGTEVGRREVREPCATLGAEAVPDVREGRLERARPPRGVEERRRELPPARRVSSRCAGPTGVGGLCGTGGAGTREVSIFVRSARRAAGSVASRTATSTYPCHPRRKPNAP
jgi:hypothetical protein